ncbi:MAG: AAA family ATPase [Gammaproteobacteria bacterium]|nr:AAA family ATPase [Gammaproteobacteria bacterium]
MLVKDTEYFTTPETSQRFDLIRHLIENSEIVPLVRGPKGIGKSLLAARIQETAPENWSVCLLEANSALSPEQLLAAIARCAGWTDLREDLLQGLIGRFEMMREQRIQPVILVDEAHLLPPTALITLLRLYERQRVGEPLVSIVLFADDQIDMLLSTPQLRIMSPQSIQVIDLQPLNREEATSFMHFLLQVEGLSVDLELSGSKMTKLYRDTRGIPGLLRQAIVSAVGQEEEEQSKRNIMFSPLIYIMLPILILASGILWFQAPINRVFEGPEPQPQATQTNLPKSSKTKATESTLTDLSETTVIDEEPTPQESDSVEVEQPVTPASLTQEEVTEVQDLHDDVSQQVNLLPTEAVEFQALEEQGADSDAAPISQDSDLGVDVGPPIESEFDPVSEAQNAAELEPAVKQAEPDPHTETAPISAQSETSPVVNSQDAAGPLLEQAVVEDKPDDEPYRNSEWLKARPPGFYTLQLLGVERLPSLEKYILQHGLQEEVFYLKTLRNGKPWYPLLWGEFPDKQSAIQGQKKLPSAVRRSGVWARSFAELQKLPGLDR